ncbi:MAG: glycosyltransferase [Pirellulales bacterium]|nr:glycosyltransferase [Pirellulales bacterium]
MKIALVHDWLTGMRGGEKCLAALCEQLPEAPLFTLVHVPGTVSPTIAARPIHTSWLNRLPGVRHYYRGLLPWMRGAIRRFEIAEDVDCVLSLSHAVAAQFRVPSGVPHVCYCFTPIRYAWHLRDDYLRHAPRLARPLQQRLLDRVREDDRRGAAAVTRYIACSRTVSRRIAEAYGRASEVIYPPVDTEFFSPAEVEREDYYLCVSALVPYKRLDLAIEACSRTGRRLKIVGTGPQRRELARRAGPTVEWLGWCDAITLREHLRRCRALIFPGREDFGIVPVEAQACGAPVVALAVDGALETLIPAQHQAPGTAVMFDAPEVDALVAALERLESGTARLLPDLARRQAERFAAPRFADEVLRLVRRTVHDQRTEQRGPRARLRQPVGV